MYVTFSFVVVALSYAYVVSSYLCVTHTYVLITFGYVVRRRQHYACATFSNAFICVRVSFSFVCKAI